MDINIKKVELTCMSSNEIELEIPDSFTQDFCEDGVTNIPCDSKDLWN